MVSPRIHKLSSTLSRLSRHTALPGRAFSALFREHGGALYLRTHTAAHRQSSSPSCDVPPNFIEYSCGDSLPTVLFLLACSTTHPLLGIQRPFIVRGVAEGHSSAHTHTGTHAHGVAHVWRVDRVLVGAW